MGDVFALVVLVQYGPREALITYWANVVGTSFARHVKRDGMRFLKGLSIHRLLFNLSCCSLSIYALNFILERFDSYSSGWKQQPAAVILVFAAIAISWFLVNTGTISIAVSLATGKPVFSVWREGFTLYLLNFTCSAAAAGLLTMLDLKNVGYIFLLSIPIAVGVYQLYSFYVQRFQDADKHIADLNKLYLQTVDTLASAVDAKDRYTHGHIRRVTVYTMELARCMGITGKGELMGLRAGALLHDIGKIAIPEYILNKPASLTESEYDKMKLHPGIGANMLKNIEFPYPVIPMVLSHHERWDGKGYPEGLSGEAISIGARILSVADCYDALTTNRPYRSPMQREEVITFFQRESGKAYDPDVIATFIANLSLLEEAGKTVVVDDGDLWGIRAQMVKETQSLRPLEKVQPIITYGKALRGDAESQRNLFAVFEFARADIQFMAEKDVMLFMGSKLANLIPFDAGVFYIADLERSRLVAEHVVGLEGGPIQNFTIPLEQKLSGWAAANTQSLFNLPPFPDFVNWEGGNAPSFQYSVIAPMSRGGVVFGAISLYRTEKTKFTDEEFRRLELVASQTALALSKCRNTVQEGGMTDKLTNLPNGYQLYLMFDQVAADAFRFDYSIAFLTIRLDDAKLRQKWGHVVGDEAICAVATYLTKELRETDLLVRYANDEFIVLVPRVDYDRAEGLKSRFQDDLDHFRFQVRPGSYVSLPVSIGISMFPSDGSDLDSLITAAEWRMKEDAELRVAARRGLRSLPTNS